MKVMRAKMETAVIEIGLFSSDTIELATSGSLLTVVCVDFNSLPQCQQTVSVGRIVWSQLSHFKATNHPLNHHYSKV